MIVLAKLVGLALYPLNLALIALLAGLLLRRRRRWSQGLLLFASGWLWLWSTPWVAERAAASLEARYPAIVAAELPTAQAIVRLGGLMAPAQPPDRPLGNLNHAADRARFAAQAWHAGKAPILICSGGLAPLSRAGAAECPDIARLLGDFGVPADAVRIEAESRTTAENAQETARLLAPGTRVLLVTSATHMARAVESFRRAGLDPIPAATDHQSPGHRRFSAASLLPNVGALALSTQVWHEWLGLLLYAVYDH